MNKHSLQAYKEGRVNAELIKECKTNNGDKYTGDFDVEGNEVWFSVIDSNGNEYQTKEIPVYRLPITIVVHSNGEREIYQENS